MLRDRRGETRSRDGGAAVMERRVAISRDHTLLCEMAMVVRNGKDPIWPGQATPVCPSQSVLPLSIDSFEIHAIVIITGLLITCQ